MKLSEVHDRLAIDRNSPDEALIDQVSLVEEVGDAYVRAISLRDNAKNRVKSVEADTAQRIRDEYAESGEKLTEKSLAELVERDEGVKSERERLEKLTTEARQWEYKHEAVRQRGYAIHKIADLMIAQGAAVVGQHEMGSEERDRRARDRSKLLAEARAQNDAEVQKSLSNRRTGKARRKRRI